MEPGRIRQRSVSSSGAIEPPSAESVAGIVAREIIPQAGRCFCVKAPGSETEVSNFIGRVVTVYGLGDNFARKTGVVIRAIIWFSHGE